MEKILVEVYVPVLSTSWDIFIPQCLKMYDVLEMIKRAIAELSNGRFMTDENTVICYRENGAIININLSVAKLELRNGSKLMLI